MDSPACFSEQIIMQKKTQKDNNNKTVLWRDQRALKVSMKKKKLQQNRLHEWSVLHWVHHINESIFGDHFHTVLLLSYWTATRHGTMLLATVVAGFGIKQLQASVLPVKQTA